MQTAYNTTTLDMTSVRPGVWATVFYVAAALALTYPLVLGLPSIVPSDPGDPLLNAWILWWNAQVAPFTATWWNAPSFFPARDSLALSEHLFGLSLFTTPVLWLTGNAQLTYNLAFLLTFVLSALGGYVLGFTLTKRSDAAFVAGLAFGFAPYRMGQLPHIQTLASFWMPFALTGLHKYLAERRTRWLGLFAATTLLQGLTNGYYLLFFPVLIGLWVLWFVLLAEAPKIKALAAIGAAFGLACLPLVPLLLHYREVHRRFGLRRSPEEIASFGADISGLVRGLAELAVWGRWLAPPGPEGQLFPGLTVVLLIGAWIVWGLKNARPATAAGPIAGGPARQLRRTLAAAAMVFSMVTLSYVVFGPWKHAFLGIPISVTRLSKPLLTASLLWLVFALTAPRGRAFLRSQAPFVFYVGGATIMWLLSFGPELKFFGQQILTWASSPYRWLTVLPGYDGLRVPARFAMLATLCLAAAASLAVAHLSARLTRAGQILLATMASLGILADGWLNAMPLAPGAVPSVLAADIGPGAVLELPLGNPRGDVGAMYRAITHRHPVVNGFSGYAPPHYQLLHFLLRSRDPSVLTELASLGVRHVVVWTHADPDGDWRAYVSAYPGATLVKIFQGQAYYRLAAVESRPSLSVAAQVPVARVVARIGQEETDRLMDGDLTTRWTIGAPQTGAEDEQLIADLGTAKRVSGVDLALGSFRADFPRELSVERSLDGKSWMRLWDGRTAGLALAGALEEPIRLPVHIRFGPVEARYIRLRQLSSDPLAFWSVAELAVLGLAEPQR